MDIPRLNKVAANKLVSGKLYVWRRYHDQMQVVKLSACLNGVVTVDADEDTWYFADNLIGGFFGPINLDDEI